MGVGVQFAIRDSFYRIDYQKYQINVKSNNSVSLQTKSHSRQSNNFKYFAYVLLGRNEIGLESVQSVDCHSHIARGILNDIYINLL